MKYETKFEIGNNVYVINYTPQTQWLIVGRYKIKSHHIYADKDGVVIDYGMERTKGVRVSLLESECFKTKKEAQAMCKKRNGS